MSTSARSVAPGGPARSAPTPRPRSLTIPLRRLAVPPSSSRCAVDPGYGTNCTTEARDLPTVRAQPGPAGSGFGATRPDSYAATTACARSRAPSFIRIRLTWVLAVDSSPARGVEGGCLDHEEPEQGRGASVRSRSRRRCRASEPGGLGTARGSWRGRGGQDRVDLSHRDRHADPFVTVDGHARGRNLPANYGGATHSDTATNPTRNGPHHDGHRPATRAATFPASRQSSTWPPGRLCARSCWSERRRTPAGATRSPRPGGGCP
jgi:hypothetical protein